MSGNFKLGIYFSWQFGFMLSYFDQKIAIELPIVSIAYSWESNAHGFEFLNFLGDY